LAQNTSTTDDLLCHFLNQADFDIVATLQATSPLTSEEDLDAAIDQFLAAQNDSLLTGVRLKRFVWTADGQPLNYDPYQRPFSQNFAGSVMENGAFYLTSRHILETHRNRLGGSIGIFEMNEETAVEIDTPADWIEVEKLLTRKLNHMLPEPREIGIIITDFDGVWTDNKVLTFADSSEAVYSSKLDSLGLDWFRSISNLPILVVSKERHPILASRCAKLKLDVLPCVDDKVAAIEPELERRNLTWAQVCYIGNDLNDLECMSRAKLAFCPADAVLEIKAQAHYILNKPGGNGAVREMFELLIERS
jgi:N-acylneuraminate cytidylyltransferase